MTQATQSLKKKNIIRGRCFNILNYFKYLYNDIMDEIFQGGSRFFGGQNNQKICFITHLNSLRILLLI
jgi:hypothetical protein